MSDHLNVLTITWLAAMAGHETGDYLVQRDYDARHKHDHTPEGRRALATHVVTYGITQAVMKAAALRVVGIRVPWRALLAGQFAEIALHAIIDDGRLLRRYAVTTGKLQFHDLNAGGMNGRMLLDQAAHKGLQIPLGALITAVLSCRAMGGSRDV